MVLLDDLVVGLGAAVTTASLVVLATLLVRYRKAVSEASKSSDMAKNVWDSMQSRLAVQDTRIIDLMARVEVYSVRKGPAAPGPSASLPPPCDAPPRTSRVETPQSQPMSQAPLPAYQSETATKDTEATILRALVEGPRTANQIRDVISLSREHTGRLMKQLYTRGLVVRNDRNKPYVYEVTEAGRRYLSNSG